MKKLIFSAVALLVLAGSSASAITMPSSQISVKPTKPTTPTPGTDTIPPMCPPSDPNGCGILD